MASDAASPRDPARPHACTNMIIPLRHYAVAGARPGSIGPVCDRRVSIDELPRIIPRRACVIVIVTIGVS